MTSVDSDKNTSLSIQPSGGFWKPFFVVSAIVVSLLFILSSGTYIWAQRYDGRIPPGIFIANVDVGGQDPEQVRQLLQARIDTILTNGIPLTVEGETETLMLTSLSTTDSVEDVAFDLDTLLIRLMSGHHENPFVNSLKMIGSAVEEEQVDVILTIEEDRIKTSVLALFPYAEVLSQHATFSTSWNTEKKMWSIGIVDGTSGKEFQWDVFFEKLKRQLVMLQSDPISLSLEEVTPHVFTEDEKHELISKAATALQTAASYDIFYEDLTWELTGDELATMLAPGDDLRLTLLEEPFAAWVATITKDVNQEVRDARLTVENGRVVDFVESLEGRTLNEQQLKEDLLKVISVVQEEPHEDIELVVAVVEPTITTGDVNDLGIDEVLGVGTSSYRGSPTNRRTNIQNGVTLLNGILIAPGETFSLLAALAPFTIENGYLPELVIKGDKITPEIGGGLCQIGTTTFRATMNSGLPVVERQNHSIVVSYYNDPGNGNPGTDATIYEPSPDFKFTNDTDNYVLFQAENNTERSELAFTFWGTSDGRTGSYTPPVVLRWIPVSETQRIETTDLEPGKETCQSAHIGADASFTYTIVRSPDLIEETLFTSHYRPLPEICLVGVEELTEEKIETTDETQTSTETEQESQP